MIQLRLLIFIKSPSTNYHLLAKTKNENVDIVLAEFRFILMRSNQMSAHYWLSLNIAEVIIQRSVALCRIKAVSVLHLMFAWFICTSFDFHNEPSWKPNQCVTRSEFSARLPKFRQRLSTFLLTGTDDIQQHFTMYTYKAKSVIRKKETWLKRDIGLHVCSFELKAP